MIIYIYTYIYIYHHHHHRLTAVLSRQTRVSRFPQYHLSPPTTVISILNIKAQWLHIHLDGVHPCLLGSSRGLPSSTSNIAHLFTQSSSDFRCTCPNQRNLFLLITSTIDSTPKRLLSSMFVCLSRND